MAERECTMKVMIRQVNDHGKRYEAIAFVCVGCIELERGRGSGLHMIPVNTDQTSPAWDWNGDLQHPTLKPSINTHHPMGGICHSYITEGQIQYLEDCTHSFAGKTLDLEDLPDWFINEVGDPDDLEERKAT